MLETFTILYDLTLTGRHSFLHSGELVSTTSTSRTPVYGLRLLVAVIAVSHVLFLLVGTLFHRLLWLFLNIYPHEATLIRWSTRSSLMFHAFLPSYPSGSRFHISTSSFPRTILSVFHGRNLGCLFWSWQHMSVNLHNSSLLNTLQSNASNCSDRKPICLQYPHTWKSDAVSSFGRTIRRLISPGFTILFFVFKDLTAVASFKAFVAAFLCLIPLRGDRTASAAGCRVLNGIEATCSSDHFVIVLGAQ